MKPLLVFSRQHGAQLVVVLTLLQLFVFFGLVVDVGHGFTLSSKSVSQLLTDHAAMIGMLKEQATSMSVDVTQEPYANDVFFLRYCLLSESSSSSPEEASERLTSNLQWRLGEGKFICDAAQTAIAQATKGDDGKWKNDVVMMAAPHSDKILQYLQPSNILTTSTSRGDLMCCIRAGDINDVELMKLVSVDEMVDFFVYAKEVNAAVSNTRSVESNRLQCLLAANSLDGVKLIGGEAKFRAALSASSKKADPLYPTLSGPTLLLNLPPLLGALVKLFTPLFPPAVKERIRFERGPLKDVTDLRQITYGGAGRDKFLAEIDALVYEK